jgi:hypothetical protein
MAIQLRRQPSSSYCPIPVTITKTVLPSLLSDIAFIFSLLADIDTAASGLSFQALFANVPTVSFVTFSIFVQLIH